MWCGNRSEGPIPEGTGGWQVTVSHVQRFRSGLAFNAHRLLYHSTLGLRVTKKKKDDDAKEPTQMWRQNPSLAANPEL